MDVVLVVLSHGKTAEVRIANVGSICDLSTREVLVEAFDGPHPGEFGVIGGPPCPDFSNGGTHAGGNGSNGKLTSVFVDIICSLLPSFFVIENVAGCTASTNTAPFSTGRFRSFANTAMPLITDSKCP